MWREQVGWTAARVVLPWLPGAILFAVLFERGAIDVETAAFASLALLALTFGATLITDRWLISAARDSAVTLGPSAAPGDPGTKSRLSPAARAIRPALLRLDRAWRAEAASLQARLAAADAIIAAAPDPLILIDRQRRILRANAASAEYIGAGTAPRDLAAALRNPMLLAAADAVLVDGGSHSVEFTVAVPIERTLRAHIAGIDGPALDGAAAILSLHDMTAMKRSEQMRADFVANAGHELKTPLAALIGFIETLLGPARDDPAARARFLGIMGEQARRMARLVDDLLWLSRIELNEHVAPTGQVALPPVIDEVARGLELRAAERGIQIVRHLPAELPAVIGERDELAQIFQNLLDNAVKYAQPGSEVTVTAERRGAAPGMVTIAVRDQGEGISSEHLPRLTERFYRVDTARSRELGGTGLGLAIVKHIVSRHRGRLDIASAVGQGSTFTVWLRAAPPRDISLISAVTETQ